MNVAKWRTLGPQRTVPTKQTQTHAEKSWVRWRKRDDCQFNEIVLHSIELPTEKENKTQTKKHQN